MGRQLRATLPTMPSQLTPKLPNYEEFHRRDKEEKWKQALSYNKKHNVIDRGELTAGSSVWVKIPDTAGRLMKTNPRSWVVNTPQQKLVRNTYHLIPVVATQEDHVDIADWHETEPTYRQQEERPETKTTTPRDEEESVDPNRSEEVGVFLRYG